MFRSLLVAVLVLACALPVLSQVSVPDKVIQQKLTQTGWHLDYVQILFDGTSVVGLGTPQKVVAYFQGYQKVSGVKTAIPGLGLTVTISDSTAVKRILKAKVSSYTIREMVRDAVFRQAKLQVGVSDSSITAEWGNIVTVPPDSLL